MQATGCTGRACANTREDPGDSRAEGADKPLQGGIAVGDHAEIVFENLHKCALAQKVPNGLTPEGEFCFEKKNINVLSHKKICLRKKGDTIACLEKHR